MTPLEKFTERWRSCHDCRLHQGVHHHVLYRGDIPADILFVGEAPGKVENSLGKPFVGPSGQLLNTALRELGLHRYLITNTVCCIPWLNNDKSLDTIRIPNPSEVQACAPHLHELIELAAPRAICSLGEIAKALLSRLSLQGEKFHLRHPAYVLRRGGHGSLEYKKFLKALQDACVKFDIDHTPVFTEASYAEEVTSNEG